MNTYVIAAIGEWNKQAFDQISKYLKDKWLFCSTPTELKDLLEENSPRYIFFPHWRWIVPEQIIQNFECICFHMTDVPYGRGGSPLQNLIVRGHKDTKLTALRMEAGLDSGPVYLKKDMSLSGSANEIYQRATALAWDMIQNIITNEPKPITQVGELTLFKRRTPKESEIPNALSLDQVYDYIRMLDAPDYPHAFLEIGNYCLTFHNAELIDGKLSAKVTISTKE